MITKPTVLVLGAGASAPYGFPTAEELKRLICDTFATPDSSAVSFLAGKYDHQPDQFVQFREAFRKSGKPSVDEFLEHRTEFVDIGKLAIAYCLIPFEDEEHLFPTSDCRGGDWYQYLFNKLNAPFEEFGNNRLSVVTFNYDRSLEHYLLTTLANSHGRSPDECKQVLAKLPIIHVYGQLSRAPYGEPGSRPYHPDPESSNSAGYAAAGIKILHEADPALGEAHKLLTEANKVCFLGFSYHQLNVERLTLKDSSYQRSVFGTALGLEGDEVTDAKQRLLRALLCSNVTLDRSDNLFVLRQRLILG